jgi:hypothetical protein
MSPDDLTSQAPRWSGRTAWFSLGRPFLVPKLRLGTRSVLLFMFLLIIFLILIFLLLLLLIIPLPSCAGLVRRPSRATPTTPLTSFSSKKVSPRCSAAPLQGGPKSLSKTRRWVYHTSRGHVTRGEGVIHSVPRSWNRKTARTRVRQVGHVTLRPGDEAKLQCVTPRARPPGLKRISKRNDLVKQFRDARPFAVRQETSDAAG